MIKLNDVINEEMILLDVEVENKDEIINLLVDKMDEAGKLVSRDVYFESVQAREEILSTFCGVRVAIPHGISETVKEPGICFARVKEFGWGSPENITRYVFLLAVPKSEDGQNPEHIKLLSAIAVSSLDDENREIWENATTKLEILKSLEPAIKKISEK